MEEGESMDLKRVYEAAPEQEVFQKVLDKFFHGERDSRTIQLLGEE